MNATVRLTQSEDMGIFIHVTKKDGYSAGMCLDGTTLEKWAKEILQEKEGN